MLNEKIFSDRIATGGVLDKSDVDDLKSRGFSAVVNLLTPDEPGFSEQSMVESSGLSYHSIPVSLDLLNEDAVHELSNVVEVSQGHVAVHCKGGGRAGILSLLYLARKNGWSVEQARAEGAKLDVKIGTDSIYSARFDELVRGFGNMR